MNRTAFTKTIEFDLSSRSIDAAVRELQTFQQQLKAGIDDLCNELLEDGVFHAKVQIQSLDAVDTGALMASIGHGAFDPQTRTGIIYAGSYYALFVEFGTGIIGQDNRHPTVVDGTVDDFAVMGSNGSIYTKYDTHNHGDDGWVYRKVGENKFRWTKGMPARPFMYNTYLTLKGIAEDYGGKIIGEYIR